MRSAVVVLLVGCSSVWIGGCSSRDTVTAAPSTDAGSAHHFPSGDARSSGAKDGSTRDARDAGTEGGANDAASTKDAGATREADGAAEGGTTADGGTQDDAWTDEDAGTTDATAPCKPVRHYVYTLATTQPLQCVPGNASTVVFSQAVPDRGRALARITLNLVGVGDPSYGVHGWSGNVEVGDLSFAGEDDYGAGEDLCPGESLTRQMLGYGMLTAKSHIVSVPMHEYRSSACENGVITVAAGSTLEVWVEDAAAQCQGTEILFTSYFQTIWAAYGTSADMPVPMTTSFTPILSTTVTTTVPTAMHVISQSEMSPAGTSNTCGDRTETGVAAISENGNYVAEQEGGYPQSGGETHLLLGPELTLPKQPAGTYVFGIADAVNQTAQDGAPVGATFSGDTILAVVLGGS